MDLLDTYYYIHDNDGNSIQDDNEQFGDYLKGVGHMFQDSIVSRSGDKTYLGYGFATNAIYDKDFALIEGTARTYYSHTWDETDIRFNGVTVDSNGGISISISPVYSNNEEHFYSSSSTGF